MNAGNSGDVWAVGSAYERYIGRWSRLVAREFLLWLAVPAGRRWLDVGGGTGALSRTILEHGAPSTIVGIDASAGFIDHARSLASDPRASFQVGDAQALPFESASFDAAVSGLGGQGPAPAYCMSLSEEHRARLREAIRAALPIRPDGSLALIARAWAVKGRAA